MPFSSQPPTSSLIHHCRRYFRRQMRHGTAHKVVPDLAARGSPLFHPHAGSGMAVSAWHSLGQFPGTQGVVEWHCGSLLETISSPRGFAQSATQSGSTCPSECAVQTSTHAVFAAGEPDLLAR
jgi:hypothetical protein